MLELNGFFSVKLCILFIFNPIFDLKGIFSLFVNFVYSFTIRYLSKSSKSIIKWLNYF